MTVIILLILTMWSLPLNLESNGQKRTRKTTWLILKHWQQTFNKYTEIWIINVPYSRECSSSARRGRTFNIRDDDLLKTQVCITALPSFHWSLFVRCSVYYNKPKVIFTHSSNHKKSWNNSLNHLNQLIIQHIHLLWPSRAVKFLMTTNFNL